MPKKYCLHKLDVLFIVVHFWAPTFKWGISIANIADFSKPPEKLSYPQQIGKYMNSDACMLYHGLLMNDVPLTTTHTHACTQSETYMHMLMSIQDQSNVSLAVLSVLCPPLICTSLVFFSLYDLLSSGYMHWNYLVTL